MVTAHLRTSCWSQQSPSSWQRQLFQVADPSPCRRSHSSDPETKRPCSLLTWTQINIMTGSEKLSVWIKPVNKVNKNIYCCLSFIMFWLKPLSLSRSVLVIGQCFLWDSPNQVSNTLYGHNNNSLCFYCIFIYFTYSILYVDFIFLYIVWHRAYDNKPLTFESNTARSQDFLIWTYSLTIIPDRSNW